MPIPKLTTDLNHVAALTDKPTPGILTAAQLKAVYDQAGNEIKNYLNSLSIYSQSEVDAIATAFTLGQIPNINSQSTLTNPMYWLGQ